MGATKTKACMPHSGYVKTFSWHMLGMSKNDELFMYMVGLKPWAQIKAQR